MARGAGESQPPISRRASKTGTKAGPRRRTDEQIEAELREFTAGCAKNQWPTRLTFQRAGRGALWSAMRNRGGSVWWAQRLGFTPRSQQDRRAPSEAEAVELARSLVGTHGYLPSAERLRASGFPKLATVVARVGGAAAFRRRHGL
jgi:hypothetical protein